VCRVLRKQNIRKWRTKKRIPITKENAKDRNGFASYWLKNIEELEQVNLILNLNLNLNLEPNLFYSRSSPTNLPAKTTQIALQFRFFQLR
jgi:hypothetical protein